MSSVKLTQGSLGAIKSSGITVPSYERAALAEDPAIVHLGVGGFHRSHMALYTCDALRHPEAQAGNWAICGVGVMPGDAAMRDALGSQDGRGRDPRNVLFRGKAAEQRLNGIAQRSGKGVVAGIKDSRGVAEDRHALADVAKQQRMRAVVAGLKDGAGDVLLGALLLVVDVGDLRFLDGPALGRFLGVLTRGGVAALAKRTSGSSSSSSSAPSRRLYHTTSELLIPQTVATP